MQWFIDWWQGLSTLSQAFACAAIPASILLFLQTILLIFGAGFGNDGDSDVDVDGDCDADCDFDHDHDGDFDQDAPEFDSGLRVFTIRGLVAFFAIGGWAGIVAIDGGLLPALSLFLSLVAGTAALLFAAYVIKWALKMQDNGNLNLRNAIAHVGTVYIPIPPNRSGTGQITVLLQGRLTEIEAVSDSDVTLKTGSSVQVAGIVGGNCLIVRPMILQSND